MRKEALLAGVLLLALGGAVLAQPHPQPVRLRGAGTEAFRAVLASYGLKPLGSIGEVADFDPKETLIISFRSSDPRPEPMASDWLDRLPARIGGARGFVEQGGAILVASDYQKSGGWADQFGVRIFGKKVYARDQETPRFMRRQECPFVESRDNVVPDLFRGSRHPLREVATNNPSFLSKTTGLTTLAEFPEGCAYVDRGNAVTGDLPFAQGMEYATGGRLLVLADQDVFGNNLMLPEPPLENDNLDFTFNCLDWLTNGRERKHVLFVNDNRVETDFNLILKSLPPTTPEQILDYLREHPEEIVDYLRKHPELITNNLDKASPFVAALEDEGVFADLEQRNIFNRMLLENFEHWVFVRNTLVFGAVILLGYGLWRFIKLRRPGLAGVPRFAVALERYRPRVGLLERRLRESLRVGQHYEAARETARALFADLGLTPAAEGLPPAFEISTSWWRRGRIEADLREIWGIAFANEPEPVSAKRWQKWPARLAALRRQIDSGVIRFVG